MRVLYNILFTVAFVLSSPYYFIRMRRRGDWQRGFWQRFGKFDSKFKQAITNRHTLWIHAVSVGEVNVCTQLIRALEPRIPNVKIVVSTTTTTGMAELEKKLPSHISKIYYPIDSKKAVRKSLVCVSPKAVILVEAEIWPNFLWKAHDMGTPTFLVNARLSERSYRGYKRFGILFRPLFGMFAGVGAQSQKDAERLKELGCRPEAIRIVGSLKFDAAKLDERRLLDVPGLLDQLGVNDGDALLVAGSTHDGEEKLIAEAFLKLRASHPKLFLIVVPRHFERSRDVARQLDSLGVRFMYRNEITRNTQYRPGELDCLLVNTTGELKYFYEHATIIFVGKSLTAEGGQNPIEPGALGKPMVFGPNMQNFQEIARQFTERGGAVQVEDAAALEQTFGKLLDDPARRTELGRRALEVVHENLGAVDRTVDMIIEHLDSRELYIAPRPQVN